MRRPTVPTPLTTCWGRLRGAVPGAVERVVDTVQKDGTFNGGLTTFQRSFQHVADCFARFEKFRNVEKHLSQRIEIYRSPICG